MKIRVISGKAGSGKTSKMLQLLERGKDNLIVTNDPAVFYIEMYMARNKIPGRCVGINSLAKVIAEDTGMILKKQASSEIEIAIVSQILHGMELKSFKEDSYNNGLSNKMNAFILQCKEEGVEPNDLRRVASVSPKATAAKLIDMANVYEKYNAKLDEIGYATKEDIFSAVTNRIMSEPMKLPYANIFVDTLDRYNKSTIALVCSLIPCTETLTAIFNKTSRKAYDYDIYAESMRAMVETIDFAQRLPFCQIEQIEAARRKDDTDGLNIIERELFNRDTCTVSNAENVVLHEASTIHQEVNFIVSNIKKLLDDGAKYSEIILTSSSVERYIGVLEMELKNNNIPYYYFKNTSVDKSSLFELIDTILDIKSNDLNTESLLKLCHLNYIGLTPDEIVAVDTFYARFGDEIITAIKNGEKYDAANTLVVQGVVQKLMMPINDITDDPENAKELFSDIYRYFDKINIKEVIVQKAVEAQDNSFIHASSETINVWNDIMSLFNSIVDVFGDDKMDVEEIRDIFSKMAAEKISKSGDLYHGQMTILDIENAQSRKSKYLFVLGCNDGYMPRPASEHVITDRERVVINNNIGCNLKSSDDYQTYKNAAIYNTLILPQKKLFVSWSLNDFDFKQLKPASILGNIIKAFPGNIMEEKDLYDNDEQRFSKLLANLSNIRYKHSDVDIMQEFSFFANNPKYQHRLNRAMWQMANEKIHFMTGAEAYGEAKYFSVTRLEKYYDCPFKHYMEFAINPERRKLFAETAADRGNYNHLAYKEFFDRCLDGKISLSISPEEYEKELESIFAVLDKEHNDGYLESSSKNRYLAGTMKERIKTSLWMAIEQLRKGDFKIMVNEYSVGRNISLPIKIAEETFYLTGIIDRVDRAGEKLRVIDYKSGNIDFDTQELRVGIQLQLPIYSYAMEQEDIQVAGMHYFRMKDFILDVDENNSPLREYRLSGPTIDNLDTIMLYDRELENGKASDVISAELTTKGDISKRSKVVSSEEMHELMDVAMEKAKDAVSEILDGDSKAFPLVSKNHDACTYCKYKGLCGIDRTVKTAIRRPSEAIS